MSRNGAPASRWGLIAHLPEVQLRRRFAGCSVGGGPAEACASSSCTSCPAAPAVFSSSSASAWSACNFSRSHPSRVPPSASTTSGWSQVMLRELAGPSEASFARSEFLGVAPLKDLWLVRRRKAFGETCQKVRKIYHQSLIGTGGVSIQPLRSRLALTR